MVLLDTNVFIYLGNETVSLSKIENIEVCYASVSIIEALGFQNITAAEQRALRNIFDAYQRVELSLSIIERAVTLRQNKKMSLGDSIIAATALDSGLEFWTANTDDFKHISGLNVFNPLQR